ncbi:MAG: hypothetical protein AAF458_07380 [Pseudomonadota bacterium]
MPKDLLAATVIAAVAAAALMQRDPRPDNWQDRLAGLVFAYALVLCWRLIARVPTYGIFERFASDYGKADMRAPVAICLWLLFLLCASGATFT